MENSTALKAPGRRDRLLLKSAAALFMLLEHIGELLLLPGDPLRPLFLGLGCLAAPLMCRGLIDSWQHSSSRKDYLRRLLLWGAVSELPYLAAFYRPGRGVPPFNFLLTLALCVIWLGYRETVRQMPMEFPSAVFFAALSLLFDWGGLLPLLLFLFLLADGDPKKDLAAFLAAALLTALSAAADGPALMICSFLGVLLGGLLRYALIRFSSSGPFGLSAVNGRARAFFASRFFYFFYPAHLILLVLLRGFVLK